MFTTAFPKKFQALRTLSDNKSKDNAAFCELMMHFIQEEVTEKNINASPAKVNVGFSILFMLSQCAFRESEGAHVENVINMLLDKHPEINQGTLRLIMGSPVLLDVFLKKIDPLKKRELLSTQTSAIGNMQRLFFQNPNTIRVLINHGLSAEEFLSSFKKFNLDADKSWLSLISKDFPTPTDADSKAYKEFYTSESVKIRREIIRRMRLALVFPSAEKLSTLADISFKRDGASYSLIFNYFQESFQQYVSTTQATENKALTEHFEALSERKQIFEEATEILLGHQKTGNRIIPVRTRRDPDESHAEGLFVFDDLLMKINRGARSSSQASGITIFKKSPETTASSLEAYLSMVSIESTDDQGSKRWVPGNEFDEDVANMVVPNPLIVLLMKDQKVGNCTWATSKAFVLAVYFAVIRKHLKNKYPTADETIINKQALLIAKSMYKDFSTIHRAQEIKKYLDVHVEDNFKLADQEILTKMIRYAFGINGALLENIKKSQVLRNLIGANKRLFLVVAVQNDSLDLIRFVLGCRQNSLDSLDEAAIKGILKTAIETNALKTLSNFGMLFGILKDPSELSASILRLGIDKIDSNTVIALIKQYSPAPYETIAKMLKIEATKLPDDKKKARLGYIQAVQKFCAEQLIQESRNEVLKISEKQIDTKGKLEEITALRDRQTAILEQLIVGLPNATEYQRTFESVIQATILTAEQDNTAVLVHYEQPQVVEPTSKTTQKSAETPKKQD